MAWLLWNLTCTLAVVGIRAQILKWCDNLNYQSPSFETSQDLTTRRLLVYWNWALMLNQMASKIWFNIGVGSGLSPVLLMSWWSCCVACPNVNNNFGAWWFNCNQLFFLYHASAFRHWMHHDFEFSLHQYVHLRGFFVFSWNEWPQNLIGMCSWNKAFVELSTTNLFA